MGPLVSAFQNMSGDELLRALEMFAKNWLPMTAAGFWPPKSGWA